MAIITYATYVPDAMPYAYGCPAPVMIDALRNSAISFFFRSQAYRVWVTAFDLTINITTYSPTPPTQTEVTAINALYCSGVPVDEKTHEEFFALDTQWPSKTGTTAQYFTSLNDPTAFNIIPIPQATVTGAFTAQIAVIPTLTSTGVEQVFFEQWKTGIIDGALARVLRMPGREWTNLAESEKRHQWYESARDVATAQTNKGNQRRDLHVQMRRWV